MQTIVVTTLYLATIFIPLTFTTINSELFEFPKFILLLSGTLVVATAWLVDIFYYNNRPSLNPYRLSPLTYSVLAVLATQLLTTFTSLHPYTSFWGYYSRYHQGLLTTICYSILYFAALNYLDKKSVLKIIKISVGTAFIISVYAIFQRLGIDKSLWVQDVVNRPFSTLGQPNWLAAYLLPNIFLVLYLINKKSRPTLSLVTVYCVLLAAILLTRSRSGLLALSLSYPAYYLLLIRQFTFAKIKKQFFLDTFYLVLTALIVGTAFTPSLASLIQRQSTPTPSLQSSLGGTQLENGGTESGDIRKIVWTGALKLFLLHPLVGTGPETFAYSYYNTRPESHNYTSEWDFLYNKAHNEYLNLAATTGLLGLLGYLYYHYAVLTTSFTLIPRSKKTNQAGDDALRHLFPVLGAALLSFAITNFFGFSVIPVYLLMMLISVLPQAFNNSPQPLTHYPLPITYYLIISLLLLYPARLFYADVTYARGKALLDAGQPAAALPHLITAVRIRPGLDLYHSSLGEAYAQLGQVEEAVSQANTLSRLNPHHLNFHKSRAKIYLTLAAADPTYYPRAAAELETARTLAPTDPKLAYNLGLIYTRTGDNDKAAKQLEDSRKLKSDYESPYYALTLLYEQTNQKDLLPDLLQDAISHLATYSGALRDKIAQYQN